MCRRTQRGSCTTIRDILAAVIWRFWRKNRKCQLRVLPHHFGMGVNFMVQRKVRGIMKDHPRRCSCCCLALMAFWRKNRKCVSCASVARQLHIRLAWASISMCRRTQRGSCFDHPRRPSRGHLALMAFLKQKPEMPFACRHCRRRHCLSHCRRRSRRRSCHRHGFRRRRRRHKLKNTRNISSPY